MRKINSAMVQSLFSPKVIERGKNYFMQKRVTDLTFDKRHHTWTSHVHGRKTYFVELDCHRLDEGVLTVYCDCPAFSTYDECKHIVAMIYHVNDYIDSKKQLPNYEETAYFIKALRNYEHLYFVDVLTNKIPMKVKYVCHMNDDGTLKIEIKTGIEHRYVVHDLQKLLENVLHNESHYFTKKFSYDPNQHYFLEKDIQIFKLLHNMLMNETVYQTEYEYYTTFTKKRLLTISPLIVYDLFKLLSERDCAIEVEQKQFSPLKIVKHTLPFQFMLNNRGGKDFQLQIEQLNDAIYLDMYQILFLNGTFYFLTEEQRHIIEQLFYASIRNDQLFISKEQSDTFFSEALPLLKRIGHVHIDNEVAEDIVNVPLKASLYLQLKDELIIGQLIYNYGPYNIDPFSQGERDVIIIREMTKEREIMSLIEQAQFHYNGKKLYLKCYDEDVLYQFIYTFMPLLEEKVNLFVTDEIKQLIIDEDLMPEVEIKVEAETNLLEVGFSIDGVSEDDVNDLLQAVIEKKRYYRLNDGPLVSLEKENFSSLRDLFSQLELSKDNLKENYIKLPAYRTVQVDELIDVKKNYHPSFKKLLKAIHSKEARYFNIPKNLNAELRDYQKEGYQWLKMLSTYHLGGILADDMGLGKTIQTIALILSEKEKHPHLIVVPSSVVYNWRSEFKKFAPSLTVKMITGTKEERLKKMIERNESDVWITSYGTIRQDIEHYENKVFQTLILDEAQYVKNYATKTSQAVRQIIATKRFALSGTPIENSVEELWAIFQVVLPGLMPNKKTFKQLETSEIMSLTRPFILRRVKEDVLSELPEKIESVHRSQLTENQKKLYVGYLKKIQQEASESIAESGFQANRMKILAGLTRLRQLCCHPSLFIENFEGKSGKLEQLVEIVNGLKESGKRPLIFSQFTSMHELIIKQLNKYEVDYFYLHGETDAKERLQMSERFNNGEKDVFLISLRAGGTGLNLTGADTVILYDLWWNPAVEDQAAGRAHRLGQKNVVQVMRLITEGTIEEKIYELQQKKRRLFDEVIQANDSGLSSLTEEDIRQLLSL